MKKIYLAKCPQCGSTIEVALKETKKGGSIEIKKCQYCGYHAGIKEILTKEQEEQK